MYNVHCTLYTIKYLNYFNISNIIFVDKNISLKDEIKLNLHLIFIDNFCFSVFKYIYNKFNMHIINYIF